MNLAEKTELREFLLSLMKNGAIRVTFKKSDGTERTMTCTLDESVIQSTVKTTERVKKENLDVMPVWDIDKSGWRSFRLDSVKEVQYIVGYGSCD